MQSKTRPILIILMILLATNLAHAQSDIQAKVIPFQLNVREAPGIEANRLGAYAQGTVLQVTGREDDPAIEGNWVYVTPVEGGISGWVSAFYLEFPANFSFSTLPVITSGGEAPVPAPAGDQPPPSESLLTGTTTAILNFRAAPNLSSTVIRVLPFGTTVGLNARSEDGTWLQAVVDGQTGWLSVTYVRVAGSHMALPVAGQENAGTTTTPALIDPSSIVSGIGSRTRAIYLAGQAKGSRAGVFSKVGDSITASPYFLAPIGYGGAQLEGYEYLRDALNFFLQTPARTSNSFANQSLAAGNGWTSSDLLNPVKVAGQPRCGGASPLVCEYTLTRPALALIMIGTNDVIYGVNPINYRENIETIVQTSIDMGVIPVLSTIPNTIYAAASVSEYNSIIADVAQSHGIPLWNFGGAMAALPGGGLQADGIHPTSGWLEASAVFNEHELQYGYTLRNLTALQVLDAVWRGAMY